MAAAHVFGELCAKHPELKGERCSRERCVGCVRDSSRAQRRGSPAKVAEANRKWVAANREMRREFSRRWRGANLEKARDINRRWMLKWMKTNSAAINFRNARRRAAKRNATPALTAIDKARIQEFYDIAAARTAQTGAQWHVDHDVPLARGGKHHPDNLVLLPAAMNIAKGARFNSTIAFLMS